MLSIFRQFLQYYYLYTSATINEDNDAISYRDNIPWRLLFYFLLSLLYLLLHSLLSIVILITTFMKPSAVALWGSLDSVIRQI